MSDLDMSGKFCRHCGDELTVGRVKYGSAVSCVKCADTPKKAAITIISGKNTYSEVQFTDAETARTFNRAQYRQGQSPGYGMKGTQKLS